jgi:L-cysteine S-thiosulfotransferase
MIRRLVLLPLVLGACTAAMPLRDIAVPRSGVTFSSSDIIQLQNDDAGNPGMLWVEQGKALWREAAGMQAKSCASCHGDAEKSMRGVAARYPVVDPAAGTLLNVEGRINQCRVQRQQAEPLRYESEALLALTTYVAHQSRGMPMQASIDGPARAHFEAGRAHYVTRQGQLNLSCAHCHERNWGKTLLAEPISQGQSNGFPAYRFEWQGLGSLHRRLRACQFGIRAEQSAAGSQELLDLELYLAWRANGLPVEAPGVRR